MAGPKDGEAQQRAGGGEQGRWRGPWGLLAVAGVCVLAVGFGVGFGVGWGAWGADNSSSGSSCSSSVTVTPDGSNGNNIDIIRPYEPLSASVMRGGNPPGGGSPEIMLRRKVAIEAAMGPAFQVITHAVGALSGANITVEPRVMQSFVMRAYADNQDLLSRLYYAAQRLQVSPKFLASVSDIASALIDIFNYIRKGAASGFATAASTAASGHHHHRSLQQTTTSTSTTGSRSSSNQPLPEQLLAAFVRAGLQAPELQGALGGLSATYGNDLDELVQLVVDLYVAIRDLATKVPGLSDAMKAFHPESPVRNNTRAPQTVGGLRNTSVKVTVTVRSPKIDFVVEDGTPGGRRLLQSATDPPLPAGFTPKAPADRPSLLIPIAFHIMLYDNGDGTWGPPDYQNAASMADRMVQVANYRLAPAKIQLFIREVRADPVAWPYLRHASHEAYNDCVADDNFYYVMCGEGVLINTNAVDFPRTVNVYVVGDDPSWAGYAFPPAANDEVMWGHIGLSWKTFSTSGANNRASMEGGASTLVHELTHHMGMQHTFADNRTCVDADAPLVTDTPVVAGPLWEQSKWQQAASIYCSKYWSQTLSANFDRANINAATRVGAVAAETSNTAFDSCPNLPGVDELGNYMTYAWDVCYMAFGHLSENQIAAMHRVTFESNPVQYNWAQYYAANPPAGYTPISLTAPSPSPSPSASAAPSPKPSPSPSPSGSGSTSSCRSTSEGGCPCKASWDFNSATYKDCVSGVPGAEARNSWCAVDTSSGNCGTLRAGWWAYCTPGCGSSGSSTTTPSPSPSPSPSATPDCGAGALTRRGYNCTSKPWQLQNDPSATKYTGCANPNNDVNGAWCPILKAQQTGDITWDYCQVGCPGGAAPAASTSATLPKKKCSSGYTGLPAGCTCAASYDIKFDGYGTSYTGMSGCTAYDETGGEGACVLTGCNRAVNNGKTQACGCS